MSTLLKYRKYQGTRSFLAILLASIILPMPAKSDLRQQLEGQKQEQRNIKDCFSARHEETQYFLEGSDWMFSGMRIIGDKLYRIYVEKGDGACNKLWTYVATLGVQRSYLDQESIRHYRSVPFYENPDPQEMWALEDGRLCRYYQDAGDKRVKKKCWTKRD